MISVLREIDARVYRTYITYQVNRMFAKNNRDVIAPNEK